MFVEKPLALLSLLTVRGKPVGRTPSLNVLTLVLLFRVLVAYKIYTFSVILIQFIKCIEKGGHSLIFCLTTKPKYTQLSIVFLIWDLKSKNRDI